MVKGISRQVIVVNSPDPRLFEQAIFILKDEAVAQGITEQMLLKEAKQAVHAPVRHGRRKPSMYGPVWAAGGAAVTAMVWLISSMI